MQNEPIEETYFKWLCSKVASRSIPTPSTTYWTLFRDLHSLEFVWLLSGDDNRAAEGLELRKEFIRQTFLAPEPFWLTEGCSVLEMFIGFSRRAEFNTDTDSKTWFWVFMDNLKLKRLNDSHHDVSRVVANIMDRFIWRTYRKDGVGGLFPLCYPKEDQTKVELWYQFYAYLEEHEEL